MRDRDVEAFVRETTAHLLQLAFLLTCDNGHAEDLVQEVMLGELRNWEPSDTPERRRAHVTRVLIRTHLATHHSVTRRTFTSFDHELVAFGEDGDTHRMPMQRPPVETRQLLSDLSPEQRVVLVLKYFENLDDESIASLLNLTADHVRALADRACTSMREPPPATAGWADTRATSAIRVRSARSMG
ncbi:MAG: sigma factor-like helix-turn-helix DNA-binding protein [Nocardioidaceae bacterium]